jgi:hypothetical protein
MNIRHKSAEYCLFSHSSQILCYSDVFTPEPIISYDKTALMSVGMSHGYLYLLIPAKHLVLDDHHVADDRRKLRDRRLVYDGARASAMITMFSKKLHFYF